MDVWVDDNNFPTFVETNCPQVGLTHAIGKSTPNAMADGMAVAGTHKKFCVHTF
jgi:hypothetical protein